MNETHEKIFENAKVTIDGSTIRCKDNLIQISGIARIWQGEILKREMPAALCSILVVVGVIGLLWSSFIYLSVIALCGIIFLIYNYYSQVKYHGINIELNSGKVFSFISADTDFTHQAFEMFYQALSEQDPENNCTINFAVSGTILNHLQEDSKDELEEVRAYEIRSEEERNLNEELQKLSTYYKNIENSEEILALIELAIMQNVEHDKEGLKTTYSRFISLGLIGVCNELALDKLLGKIKEAVYS